MIVEAILAYALMAQLDQSRPQFLKPFAALSDCLVEADKRNRTTEQLRDPEVRKLGGEFICLMVKRAGST